VSGYLIMLVSTSAAGHCLARFLGSFEHQRGWWYRIDATMGDGVKGTKHEPKVKGKSWSNDFPTFSSFMEIQGWMMRIMLLKCGLLRPHGKAPKLRMKLDAWDDFIKLHDLDIDLKESTVDGNTDWYIRIGNIDWARHVLQ